MLSRVRQAREGARAPEVRLSQFADWTEHRAYRRARSYLLHAVADPRYGPLYRQGTREALQAGMPEGFEPSEEQIDTPGAAFHAFPGQGHIGVTVRDQRSTVPPGPPGRIVRGRACREVLRLGQQFDLLRRCAGVHALLLAAFPVRTAMLTVKGGLSTAWTTLP